MIKSYKINIPLKKVPTKGLEPSRLSTLVPKTSVSTNSTTWAFALPLGLEPRTL